MKKAQKHIGRRQKWEEIERQNEECSEFFCFYLSLCAYVPSAFVPSLIK